MTSQDYNMSSTLILQWYLINLLFLLLLIFHFVDPQLENQDLTNVDTQGNKVYPEFPI